MLPNLIIILTALLIILVIAFAFHFGLFATDEEAVEFWPGMYDDDESYEVPFGPLTLIDYVAEDKVNRPHLYRDDWYRNAYRAHGGYMRQLLAEREREHAT